MGQEDPLEKEMATHTSILAWRIPWTEEPRGLLSAAAAAKSLQLCLFPTLWIVARQAPLSMGFSRQEYWSGLPFPSPRALPDPGIEPMSPSLQVDSLPAEPLLTGLGAKDSVFFSFSKPQIQAGYLYS